MREIKFRGFSTDLNKWVYGSLVNNMWTYSELTDRKGQPVCEIITGEYDADNWEDAINDPDCVIKVTPESVGQFTGLQDKDGVDIYADDLLQDEQGVIFRIYHVAGGFVMKANYWKANCKELNVTDELIYSPLSDPQNKSWLQYSCKIIGNLYQNPELIK